MNCKLKNRIDVEKLDFSNTSNYVVKILNCELEDWMKVEILDFNIKYWDLGQNLIEIQNFQQKSKVWTQNPISKNHMKTALDHFKVILNLDFW